MGYEILLEQIKAGCAWNSLRSLNLLPDLFYQIWFCVPPKVPNFSNE